MPFTLSHPAAAGALHPLVRRGWLPLSALVVGTMAPDFEYLIHLRPLALWGHSAVGLFAFCLPAGLAVLAAWELVVRDPVRGLIGLPVAARSADAADRRGAWSWWVRAAIAVVAGAPTHLLWDGVTHGGYWGVRAFPALRNIAFSVGDRDVPWFNVLQHASTLVGGAIVLAWLARERRGAGVVPAATRRLAVVGLVVAAAVVTGAWSGTRAVHGPSDYWSAQRWVGRVAVGALLGAGVALLCYGAAWQTLARRAARAPAR